MPVEARYEPRRVMSPQASGGFFLANRGTFLCRVHYSRCEYGLTNRVCRAVAADRIETHRRRTAGEPTASIRTFTGQGSNDAGGRSEGSALAPPSADLLGDHPARVQERLRRLPHRKQPGGFRRIGNQEQPAILQRLN